MLYDMIWCHFYFLFLFVWFWVRRYIITVRNDFVMWEKQAWHWMSIIDDIFMFMFKRMQTNAPRLASIGLTHLSYSPDGLHRISSSSRLNPSRPSFIKTNKKNEMTSWDEWLAILNSYDWLIRYISIFNAAVPDHAVLHYSSTVSYLSFAICHLPVFLRKGFPDRCVPVPPLVQDAWFPICSIL